MNNKSELDGKSDVDADLPFFQAESSEKIRVSDVRVSDEEVRDLHSIGINDDSSVENVEAEKAGSDEARLSLEINSREVDGKMDSRVSVVRAENLPFSRNNAGFGFQNSGMEHLITRTEEVARVSSGQTKEDLEVIEGRTVSDFDSSYYKFDESAVIKMPEALEAEADSALSYGFEAGDMVWGKVKSHPWWPGHIFNEAFASPSVRRSKRGGHVLVAFFGDSSYGWFDPAELIPFEPHYADKSRQTNSRNFIKAVEEAVDEASRRGALGLACFCRNPFNFRPTNVQGYFSVDVDDYEPGGVYSMKQIKKARDSFRSADALYFVKQLALMPRKSEQKGIDWRKKMATVLAYRKVVFEEFDETYAQAFGMQPVRPSRNSMGVLDQLPRLSYRAPLSGPLVIAESLGERKSSTKSTKVKDQSKKDKYMFKQREESNIPGAPDISPGPAGVSVPPAFKEGAAALATGDYVFQKRVPGFSMKPQATGKLGGAGAIGWVGEALSQGGTGQDATRVDKKPVVAKFSLVDTKVNMSQVVSPARFVVSQSMSQPSADSGTPAVKGGQEDGKPPLDKACGLQELEGRVSDATVGPLSSGKSEFPGIVDSFNQTFRQEGEAVVDLKHEESVKLSSTFEGHKQPEMRLPTLVEDHRGFRQVQEGDSGTSLIDAKLPGKVLGVGIDNVVKKAKVSKHLGEEPSSERSIMGKKKNKKKKKEPGSETNLDHPQKRLKTIKEGESVKKSAGKSIGISLLPGENPQRKVNGTISAFPSSSLMTPAVVDLGNIEVELPQLLDDLLVLALDPFHGVERNSPTIVHQIFLQFRSLVYQKSLVLAPPTEVDTVDLLGNTSATITGAAEIPPSEGIRGQPPASMPPKQLFRPDDPSKAGRKRNLSGRQEEMSAKRQKKLNELKSMVAEKKAGSVKTLEMQQGEEKDVGMALPVKPSKPDFLKKPEQPARKAEPTMLVMKFPPLTTLPSVPELKARFARFGPLDHSATRVFWKSSTCRIVFKYKSHAQAAHNFAIRNNSIFGNVRVNYHLRDLETLSHELPDSGKRRAEDTSDEATQFRSLGTIDSVGEPRQQTTFLQRPLQPSVQLKSCLKKPSGDEAAPITVPRESPRVKFILGGEESSREQLVVSSSSNNNNNNASKSDGASSLAMDINSKNFYKGIPPILPLPPRIPDMHENRGVVHFPQPNRVQYSEVVEPRNNPNYDNNDIDISHQMLSLLMRCSDIVNDVKSSLGYVPYHPL